MSITTTIFSVTKRMRNGRPPVGGSNSVINISNTNPSNSPSDSKALLSSENIFEQINRFKKAIFINTDTAINETTVNLPPLVKEPTTGEVLEGVNIPAITLDPTGFKNPELVVITGNTDRTITITGTVEAYYRGSLVSELVTGYTSAAHGTDTSKTYYLKYAGTSVAWSETEWTFNQIQICSAKYDATNAVWYYERECHGCSLGWREHEILHQNIGTFKESGGTFPAASYTADSTTAAARRPNIDTTVIQDEDLETTLAELTTETYTQFRLGTSGADVNTIDAADIVSLSTNNPYYNTYSAPNWSQTLMPANSVASVWVYGRSMALGTASQKYRFTFVQPQWITQATNPSAGAIATAVAAEKARNSSELSLGGLQNSEQVALGRIIIAYVSGNWVIKEIVELSGSKLAQYNTPAAPSIIFWEKQLSCSDLTTAITTGTTKAYFRMPFAGTLTEVRVSALTAPTGANLVIDINEAGTSILSTKLSIDAGEKTSTTAATAAVISDATLADDAEITVDFDQVGSTEPGKGIIVTLIGYRT